MPLRKRPLPPNPNDKYRQMQAAAYAYKFDEKSLAEAAALHGVTGSGLYRWMMRYEGWEVRDTKKVLSPIDLRELIRLHHHEYKSLRELGEMFRLNPMTVKRMIREAGMFTYTSKQILKLRRDKGDAELTVIIMQLYRLGIPLNEIAVKLKTSARRVRRVVRRQREKRRKPYGHYRRMDGGLALEGRTDE